MPADTETKEEGMRALLRLVQGWFRAVFKPSRRQAKAPQAPETQKNIYPFW